MQTDIQHRNQKDATSSEGRSNLELIERVIMTSGLPYTFWSAYVVEVPDLSPNDILHLNAQAEVTNDNGFNVCLL